LEEGVLFGAGGMEEVVVPGAGTAVVEGDVVVVFTVVEVVGCAGVDVVVGLAVVEVVARANRLREAAAAGSDVPRVATPIVTASATVASAPSTASERVERTTRT
jgi:hypothetical protein